MSTSGIGPAYVPQAPQSTQLSPGMAAVAGEAIAASNDHTNQLLSQLQANMAGKEDVGKLRDELGSLRFSLQNQVRLMTEQGNTMSPAHREALGKQIMEGLARAIDLENRINRIAANDPAAALALAIARAERAPSGPPIHVNPQFNMTLPDPQTGPPVGSVRRSGLDGV